MGENKTPIFGQDPTSAIGASRLHHTAGSEGRTKPDADSRRMALQLLCAFSAADVPPCAMYPERCAKLAGSTGSAMPLVALGTWRGSYKDCSNNNYTCVRQRAKSAVSSWIELDGTHIDTANDYRTQVEVGEAVTASGRQRSELFLTTKCPGPMGFLATIQCAEDNLQMLGQYGVTTGYLDLLLIHFPFIIKPECYGSPSTEECKMPYVDPGDEARLETWRAMELLQRQGRARAIGLSDYNATQLAHTIANAKQPVAVHQVPDAPMEWHAPAGA